MTDQRITVLRVIDRLNVGGPAIHVALTSSGVDPARFRTVLVTGSIGPGEEDMSYLCDQLGVQRVVIPPLGRELRLVRDLTTAWALWKVIRRERPQILHTHKAKAGALGRVLGLVCRVPVRVHTFHGHVFQGYFGPKKTLLFLTIERLLARGSSRLVVLSETLAHELSERYAIAPKDRFAVIPLGFDLRPFADNAGFRGELRKDLGLSAKTRLIGIVGRMVPVKDHRTFIAAAAELAERRGDVHFVFIGGGELLEQVRNDLVQRNLSTRSHLVGWRRDLARIYADLDVVALSSINEGTPVTLIEAMASGVPVVSTDVGGVRDILANGARGELVPASHPSAFAEAMERALAPRARERAAAIRPEILREFGAERLCRDLAELYEKLLDEVSGHYEEHRERDA